VGDQVPPNHAVYLEVQRHGQQGASNMRHAMYGARIKESLIRALN